MTFNPIMFPKVLCIPTAQVLTLNSIKFYARNPTSCDRRQAILASISDFELAKTSCQDFFLICTYIHVHTYMFNMYIHIVVLAVIMCLRFWKIFFCDSRFFNHPCNLNVHCYYTFSIRQLSLKSLTYHLIQII